MDQLAVHPEPDGGDACTFSTRSRYGGDACTHLMHDYRYTRSCMHAPHKRFHAHLMRPVGPQQFPYFPNVPTLAVRAASGSSRNTPPRSLGSGSTLTRLLRRYLKTG